MHKDIALFKSFALKINLHLNRFVLSIMFILTGIIILQELSLNSHWSIKLKSKTHYNVTFLAVIITKPVSCQILLLSIILGGYQKFDRSKYHPGAGWEVGNGVIRTTGGGGVEYYTPKRIKVKFIPEQGGYGTLRSKKYEVEFIKLSFISHKRFYLPFYFILLSYNALLRDIDKGRNRSEKN